MTEVIEANPQANPEELAVGQVISLPCGECAWQRGAAGARGGKRVCGAGRSQGTPAPAGPGAAIPISWRLHAHAHPPPHTPTHPTPRARAPPAGGDDKSGKNLVDLLQHRTDTRLVLQAALAADLGDELAKLKGDTVFFPTDKAFEALLKELNMNETALLEDKELLAEVRAWGAGAAARQHSAASAPAWVGAAAALRTLQQALWDTAPTRARASLHPATTGCTRRCCCTT